MTNILFCAPEKEIYPLLLAPVVEDNGWVVVEVEVDVLAENDVEVPAAITSHRWFWVHKHICMLTEQLVGSKDENWVTWARSNNNDLKHKKA